MIFPEDVAGGVPIRNPDGSPTNNPDVQNAYAPPATYASSCIMTALPNDCTARIEPRQINAIVSELVSFAECLDPDGPWVCDSPKNLCTSFNTWLAAYNAYNDARFVNVTGDTMTGALHLPAPAPVDPTEAANKKYVDDSLAAAIAANDILDAANFVNVTGDTMSGPLQLPIAAPVQPTEAANKKYVDDTVTAAGSGNDARYVNVPGDTMTGALTIKPPAASANLILDKPAGAFWSQVLGARNGLLRWAMQLGASDAETGGDTGSTFALECFHDDGTDAFTVMAGDRASGELRVREPLTSTGIATKGYVDSKAAAAAFPVGTMMIFAQTNAPVGWTKFTAHNDKLLRITSGVVGTGGVNAFSAVNGQTSTGATTLDSVSTGVHQHGTSGLYGAEDAASQANKVTTEGNDIRPANGTPTGTGGQGGPHTHPFTMNIQYVDSIFATKD